MTVHKCLTVVMAQQTETIGVRVTKNTKELIRRYLELDQHINESDFVRDAIREKIENDAPELVREMTKPSGELVS